MDTQIGLFPKSGMLEGTNGATCPRPDLRLTRGPQVDPDQGSLNCAGYYQAQ